jgi:hypothetical protein
VIGRNAKRPGTLKIKGFLEKGNLMKKGEGRKPSNLIYENPIYGKKRGKYR